MDKIIKKYKAYDWVTFEDGLDGDCTVIKVYNDNMINDVMFIVKDDGEIVCSNGCVFNYKIEYVDVVVDIMIRRFRDYINIDILGV